MKVALVYDRVNKWGGAERVLLALHELFPDAPLYTSVYNPKKAPWAKVFTVKASFLNYFPNASSAHELYAIFMPLAFESFSFKEYDLVISVTSEAAKGIITTGKTKHICYCLTPTRYLWSGYDQYFANSLNRFFGKPAISYLRWWDKIAAKRPDAYIAISREVQKRIKTYYKRNSLVVYPSFGLENIPERQMRKKQLPKDYYLVVSRLVTYKRIDLAIQACNALGRQLIVVGTGVKEKYLRSLAGPTITFTGSLTDQELLRYYKSCKALLFPGKEDFGLAVLEAQYFGRPVIAYAAGGALETVLEGKTGLFFKSQSVESLIAAMKAFEKRKFHAHDCQMQARRFSKQMFKKTFTAELKRILGKKL